MFEFSVQLATILGCQCITVTGEAFRYGKQLYASWHPFGYRIGEEGGIQMLNQPTYLQMQRCSLSFNPKTNELTTFDRVFDSNFQKMLNFLESSEHCNVFPPILMFHGTLSAAVNYFYPLMMENENPLFEGSFFCNRKRIHTEK